ncbi:hypothetical protein BIW11_06732 [Tropilaelaps mercedesae]|uniref:Uncharacterized protein n=1 Tax=Tropilaelaps mercedesae TaxID=418985 RepID=A0A1V9XWR2_9ACAR|nr:hypothetical protein BIW11_06732 [Tropilaelaps mercedesae]
MMSGDIADEDVSSNSTRNAGSVGRAFARRGRHNSAGCEFLYSSYSPTQSILNETKDICRQHSTGLYDMQMPVVASLRERFG